MLSVCLSGNDRGHEDSGRGSLKNDRGERGRGGGACLTPLTRQRTGWRGIGYAAVCPGGDGLATGIRRCCSHRSGVGVGRPAARVEQDSPAVIRQALLPLLPILSQPPCYQSHFQDLGTSECIIIIIIIIIIPEPEEEAIVSPTPRLPFPPPDFISFFLDGT